MEFSKYNREELNLESFEEYKITSKIPQGITFVLHMLRTDTDAN